MVGSNTYGVSFSPDNSKLYIAEWQSPKVIYQYNLLAGNGHPDSVVNSRILISTPPIAPSALQLAPDGKIYVARFPSDTLSVIHNPNALGASCNYEEAAFYLNGESSMA